MPYSWCHPFFPDSYQRVDQIGQFIALGLGQVGLVTFGKEREQVQRHEIIVEIVNHAYAATLALPATTPASFAHPTRAFDDVPGLWMFGQVVDQILALIGRQ